MASLLASLAAGLEPVPEFALPPPELVLLEEPPELLELLEEPLDELLEEVPEELPEVEELPEELLLVPLWLTLSLGLLETLLADAEAPPPDVPVLQPARAMPATTHASNPNLEEQRDSMRRHFVELG